MTIKKTFSVRRQQTNNERTSKKSNHIHKRRINKKKLKSRNLRVPKRFKGLRKIVKNFPNSSDLLEIHFNRLQLRRKP